MGMESPPTCWHASLPWTRPNQVWVGDITYLWTQEGWLYLSVLLDLYSRKVVGWAMSSHIDAALVQAALRNGAGAAAARSRAAPPFRSRQSICVSGVPTAPDRRGYAL